MDSLDCCSNVCFGGVCSRNIGGEYCLSDVNCCSGNCVDNQCQSGRRNLSEMKDELIERNDLSVVNLDSKAVDLESITIESWATNEEQRELFGPCRRKLESEDDIPPAGSTIGGANGRELFCANCGSYFGNGECCSQRCVGGVCEFPGIP